MWLIHCCEQQSRRRLQVKSLDQSTAANLGVCLERISRLLQDEIYASAPHLCVEQAAIAQIYKPATDIALAFVNTGIFHAYIGLLNTLIDIEEGIFLNDPDFASTVTIFAQRTLRSTQNTFEIGSSVFEVLFGVTAKLRLQPETLRCWFTPGLPVEDGLSDVEGGSPATPTTVLGDFPLFYLLLDHIHYDGKVGEFARTGLLYIINCAAHSDKLERWIIESDLAKLMASGLGALYSQLSRQVLARPSSANMLNYSGNWSFLMGKIQSLLSSPFLIRSSQRLNMM